jgi:subtilase family serine protease
VRLADLIPVPKADPPYSPQSFCRVKDKGLLIRVRNQGEATAEPSVAEVLFKIPNTPVVRPTPQLVAGNEVDLHFAFPPTGCTGGFESCPFRVTVDRGATVSESNEANNVADGGYVFLQ